MSKVVKSSEGEIRNEYRDESLVDLTFYATFSSLPLSLIIHRFYEIYISSRCIKYVVYIYTNYINIRNHIISQARRITISDTGDGNIYSTSKHIGTKLSPFIIWPCVYVWRGKKNIQ